MFQLHICILGLLIFYCVSVPSEPIHILKLLTLLPSSQLSSDWPGFGQQVSEASAFTRCRCLFRAFALHGLLAYTMTFSFEMFALFYMTIHHFQQEKQPLRFRVYSNIQRSNFEMCVVTILPGFPVALCSSAFLLASLSFGMSAQEMISGFCSFTVFSDWLPLSCFRLFSLMKCPGG